MKHTKKATKDLVGTGLVGMAGLGAMGALQKVPGMPAGAAGLTPIVGAGVQLATVGSLLGVTKGMYKDVTSKNYKRKKRK